MGGTWPSSLPPILRVAIDDVLVSDGIRVASWRTLERETGSDHVPVIAELLIPSAPAAGPGEGGVP
jgi:endonuclease/exonuclease/phosphatase family metal-dependent hydrolase